MDTVAQLNSIAALDGEEFFSWMLSPRSLGEHTLRALIAGHMVAGENQFTDVVLRELRDLEATTDQFLSIQKIVRMAGLLFDASEEAKQFFLINEVVTTIVRLLGGLLDIRTSKIRLQANRLRSCAKCFIFLRKMMRSSNGVPWVKEASENGFLSILLRTTDELKEYTTGILSDIAEELNEVIGEIIGTLLPAYMSYYSVITSLSDIRGRHTAAKAMHAQQSGPLRDKWAAFFKLMAERCTAQGLYAVQIQSIQVRCDNEECAVEAYRQDMYECDGCNRTFYCSQTCQAKAWTLGNHRLKCDRPDVQKVAWGSCDEDFFPVLSKAYIVADLQFIATQARSKFPSVPALEIAFFADFRKQPPEIVPQNINEVLSLIPETRDQVRAVAAAKKHFIIVSIHACSAHYSVPSYLRYPLHHVSSARCDELYDLLEALRLPTPYAGKQEECVDVAIQRSRRVRNLMRDVHEDFQLFLMNGDCKEWSSANAKDIVCTDFEQPLA